MQLAVETVTGRSFAAVAHHEVFEPLGMRSAVFSTEPPDDDSAAGWQDGQWLPAQAHRFVEHAAAGLWATPGDYLRFATAIRESVRSGDGFLTSESARLLIEPAFGGAFALGPSVRQVGSVVSIGHTGNNPGFCSLWLSVIPDGPALCVATNASDAGPTLVNIAEQIARDRGWTDLLAVLAATSKAG